jgi:hypothetical protein
MYIPSSNYSLSSILQDDDDDVINREARGMLSAYDFEGVQEVNSNPILTEKSIAHKQQKVYLPKYLVHGNDVITKN